MKNAFIKTVFIAATLAASMTIASAQAVGAGPNGGGGNPGGPGSSGLLDITTAPAACTSTRLCRSSTVPRKPKTIKVSGECSCAVLEVDRGGMVLYSDTCYQYDKISNRRKTCSL